MGSRIPIYKTIAYGTDLNVIHSAIGNVKFKKNDKKVFQFSMLIVHKKYNLKEIDFGIGFEIYKSTTICVTRIQKMKIKPNRSVPVPTTLRLGRPIALPSFSYYCLWHISVNITNIFV
jgi:hypothetical protein